VKLKRTECVEMNPRKIWKLLHGRRGVSAVVSNVILTGAVIAVSFVVLAWTQYRSSAYNDEYSEVMDADIAKLKERLAFEYVFYDEDAGNLSVYLMNCGKINTTVKTAYVTKYTGGIIKVFFNIKLMDFNGDEIAPLNHLGIGEEGYFVLSPLVLGTDTRDAYLVRVVTERGSTFEYMFIA
jgi:hypothetical protein